MPGRVTTKWWKEERGERDLRGLQPERARPDHRVGVLGPPATAGDGLDAARLGRAARRDPADFTVGSAGRRFAEIGDRHARIDAEAYDLTPVLEWYARDERDHGLGDLPYPPEYPKMPGEPKRVQPSRDTLRPKD